MYTAGVILKLKKCEVLYKIINCVCNDIRFCPVDLPQDITAGITKLEHANAQRDLRSFIGPHNSFTLFVSNLARFETHLKKKS